MTAASVYEIPIKSLAGEPLDPCTLWGRATLIVNVASHCGLTPQYEGLQRLYDRYRDRGLVVLATPCNQFAGQEPGNAEEIATFCATTYSVTFPLTEKIDVNGHNRHPLFARLTPLPDATGHAGDVVWNFEKFLISTHGEPIDAIESIIPGSAAPEWSRQPARELVPGDRVRLAAGQELTATRIQTPFLERHDLICLIQDTPTRWLAQPVPADADVEVIQPINSPGPPAAETRYSPRERHLKSL